MALKEPTNSELTRQIKEIKDLMKIGFDGIHSRQDITNGKVSNNSKFRVQAETSLSIFKWLFGALGIGNIALLVKLFIG